MWEKVTDFIKHPIVQLVGGPAVLAVITWTLTYLAKLESWQIWLTVIFSVGVGLLIVNQIAIWRERTKKKIGELSNEELRGTIRRWIDKPYFKVQKNEKDGLLFSFTIENQHKRQVEVFRAKEEPFTLRLGTKIVVADEHASVICELPEGERIIALSGLVMELARAGIAWSGVKHPLKEFVIEDSMPIGDGLTEFYLLQHIWLMDSTTVIALAYLNMITRKLRDSGNS